MNLLQLQEQKGSGHLFIVEIPDWGEIPFKLPSITKARQYHAGLLLSMTEEEQVMIYEYIFRDCVVDPDIAFDQEMPAGIPESIGKLILHLSGTTEDNIKYTGELFNTFRISVGDPVMFMKRTVCSIFSGYTFETLGELDYQSLVEIFINAEQIMLEAGLIPGPYQTEIPKSEKKKNFNIPVGPTGMPGVSTPLTNKNSSEYQDDTPRTSTGGIDIDALVSQGRDMQKIDMGVPAKGAHNIYDNPSYKAKQEAVFKKLSGKSK
jgi:hypothetical protein